MQKAQMKLRNAVLLSATVAMLSPAAVFGQDADAVALPVGVRPVWDTATAYREATPTRERVCLNGLWRWQPAEAPSDIVPAERWGYFKVPGSWPGITDYMQKDSQTIFAHPDWKSRKLGSLNAAWYQREFTVPREWVGRHVSLSAEYLNSYAGVFVDGKKAGEIRFPAGELDLTAVCPPGTRHSLSILVVALPLKSTLLSYIDTALAREVKGSVSRRGLCGDVFLLSQPAGPRIVETTIRTSVRQREITFGATLENLVTDARYRLRARVIDGEHVVKEFTSREFPASELREHRIDFTEKWLPEKLWDIHTPQNAFTTELVLADANGKLLDAGWKARFGFRELWIAGRDFFLNGTRIHLSAVPLDNAQVSAALSTYPAARESLERLKSFGINFVYTHNYDCLPGSHLSFAEILRAADDTGMLVALTQPHFSHYDWKAPDADVQNGYARHAAFYARVARNHPSVVFYSMSHNATGYEEDMNPDLIDGLNDPRDTWSSRNAKLALRAEAIVNRLDPSRIVYHHAGGNIGAMHAINFYPNFVPIQELSDWFGHWSVAGVKPAFMCEYGAPFTWDWTMYRGWHNGQREWGSAKVPWEFCLAEWNAQFFGDRTYAISDAEKANLRWEAKQFQAGNLWHRWDYPNPVGSDRFDERYPLFAMYLTDNWRAFRTWGVSAISPWEYEHFWKLRAGMDKRRTDFIVDWEHLQRPGFSPDFSDQRYERMDLAFERADWIATPAAQALMRNNRPLLAYIGGKPGQFTSKDHNFLAGETFEKQIIVINDSRETASCNAQWSLMLPEAMTGSRHLTVPPGGQERTPLRFKLPENLPPGRYDLAANFHFGNGETQRDQFAIQVLPPPRPVKIKAKIALFDPKGETQGVLDKLGVPSQSVTASADLSLFDILIVGKAAVTTDSPVPDITRVRDGLKVILFEQTAEVLEKRFGFRVEEYGLRQLFPRVPDHPVLAGVATEHLRDWRGESTLLPPRLKYELRSRYGPTVQWCGLPVTRLWRCGNRGNLASVLIEKPARGDFLPIIDGGYGLQYSPLMEYREGRGMILFCQLDVTGRSESDPAAEALTRNILQHVADWKMASQRQVVYVGEPAGKQHLESAGFSIGAYHGGKLSPNQVLVVGPGGRQELEQDKTNLRQWMQMGGMLMVFGLDPQYADALLPVHLTFKSKEHISAFFESAGVTSRLRGIGPADLLNRDPRDFEAITAGATTSGDGLIATAADGQVVVCQFVPWQFDPARPSNLKRTFRRAAFVATRLLSNLGVSSATPILARFHKPLDSTQAEKRWLDGLYLDQPEEWDDPYRFFRW